MSGVANIDSELKSPKSNQPTVKNEAMTRILSMESRKGRSPTSKLLFSPKNSQVDKK